MRHWIPMSQLMFTIGGFFCGQETRTFTISDDQVLVDVEKTMISMDKEEEYGNIDLLIHHCPPRYKG